MGRNWLFVAILLAATVVLAIATGYSLLWKAVYFFLMLIGLSWVWTWLNVRDIEVHRDGPEQRAQIGQTISERISVRNRSWLPKPWIEIRDHSTLPGHEASMAINLPAQQRRTWRIKTPCTRRGRFSLGPLTVVASDPVGLFRREQQIAGSGTLLVYPRTVPLPNFTLPGGELSGESRIKTRTHAITPNAAGIREYAPGDSFNRIHWASTARTGRIMVKEFELDPSSEVWLLIDMQRDVQYGEGNDSTEEYAVTIAASIGRRLIETNRSVGVIAYGETHEIVHTDRGDRQLQKLLETLALVHATGKVPLAEVIAAESTRFGRNSTLVVITPSTDDTWVHALQNQTHRGVRAVAIVLEPVTFGGEAEVIHTLGSLAAADIRTYLVKRGDDLDQALSARASHRMA
ncbi:MAG: hypothetical protein KatS3mg060_2916 [Dehalococcoidia bacterium]|nr:MAG: hypothetical protein KatS3mg060_2916 [Dehalococcoidia bacterium]